MGSLENTIVRDIYTVAFQISPIIFHMGIAESFPGYYIPVVALLGGLGLVQSVIAGKPVNINDFSFQFRPMPGSTLISQSVGTYPFANQSVAANATIQEPLNVSLHMIAPVKVAGGYITKLAQLTVLQSLFEKHNNAGGTYTILTPAKIYTDCLMLTMTDITPGDTRQDQVEFQIDFFKPLITQNSAQQALNNLMKKATGGQQVTSSSWSIPSAPNISFGSGTPFPLP